MKRKETDKSQKENKVKLRLNFKYHFSGSDVKCHSRWHHCFSFTSFFKVFILNMPVYFPDGSSRYYKPLRKYKQRLLSPDERLERRLGNFPKVFPPLCLLHLCILRYTCPVCQGLEDVSLLKAQGSCLILVNCQTAYYDDHVVRC